MAPNTAPGGGSAKQQVIRFLDSVETNWDEVLAFIEGTVNPKLEAYTGCLLYMNAGTISTPARSHTGQNVRAGT